MIDMLKVANGNKKLGVNIKDSSLVNNLEIKHKKFGNYIR